MTWHPPSMKNIKTASILVPLLLRMMQTHGNSDHMRLNRGGTGRHCWGRTTSRGCMPSLVCFSRLGVDQGLCKSMCSSWPNMCRPKPETRNSQGLHNIARLHVPQAGRDGSDFGAALNRFLLRFGSSFKVYTDAVAVGRNGIVKKVRAPLTASPTAHFTTWEIRNLLIFQVFV